MMMHPSMIGAEPLGSVVGEFGIHLLFDLEEMNAIPIYSCSNIYHSIPILIHACRDLPDEMLDKYTNNLAV